jgi:hypothetical protein
MGSAYIDIMIDHSVTTRIVTVVNHNINKSAKFRGLWFDSTSGLSSTGISLFQTKNTKQKTKMISLTLDYSNIR